jgi:hypothetical protein
MGWGWVHYIGDFTGEQVTFTMDMETLWHGNMAFTKQNGIKDKYSYKKSTTP